jgi:hypothetical protein
MLPGKEDVLPNVVEYLNQRVNTLLATVTGGNYIPREKVNEYKEKVFSIWDDIRKNSYSEKEGKDEEWRGPFLTIQAIIEESLAILYKNKQLNTVEGFIIAPMMPTPLILKPNNDKLKDIDITHEREFATLRNPILREFLRAGCKLNAVYSSDTTTALTPIQGMTEAFKNYRIYCDTFRNLLDYPILKVKVNNFPYEKTCALYYINNNPNLVITISSYQLFQR